MAEVIPEDVKQFLLANIDTIAQWEILLLLSADPARQWSAPAMAQKIYISEQETAYWLDGLAARQILVVLPEAGPLPLYQYSPASAEMDEVIRRAAQAYRRYLIPITHLIHSKYKTRVQQFADAFKLRKD